MTAATPGSRSPSRRGGLNFWQWLGIIIIVVGALAYLWRNMQSEETPPQQPQQEQDAPVQAQSPQTMPAPTTAE